jgi:hypothetical protein
LLSTLFFWHRASAMKAEGYTRCTQLGGIRCEFRDTIRIP